MIFRTISPSGICYYTLGGPRYNLVGKEAEGAPNEKRGMAWLKGNLLGCLEAHLLHIPFVPAHIALEQFSLERREDLVD